jgi:hypothetical protein
MKESVNLKICFGYTLSKLKTTIKRLKINCGITTKFETYTHTLCEYQKEKKKQNNFIRLMSGTNPRSREMWRRPS